MFGNDKTQQRQLQDAATRQSNRLQPHLAAFNQPPQDRVTKPVVPQPSAQNRLPPHLAAFSQPPPDRVTKPLVPQSSAQHNMFASVKQSQDHQRGTPGMTAAGANSVNHKPEERIADGAEVWKGLVDEPKSVLNPGLGKSIWATAEQDPRDEDFSHLFKKYTKKVAYDIPDWLCEREGETHKKPSNYLRGLGDSMHNPKRQDPSQAGDQAQQPEKKTAGEYILETRARQGGTGARNMREKVDRDVDMVD